MTKREIFCVNSSINRKPFFRGKKCCDHCCKERKRIKSSSVTRSSICFKNKAALLQSRTIVLSKNPFSFFCKFLLLFCRCPNCDLIQHFSFRKKWFNLHFNRGRNFRVLVKTQSLNTRTCMNWC